MNDSLLVSLVMGPMIAGVCIFMIWNMYANRESSEEWKSGQPTIAARQADTLRGIAARVGGRYEPGNNVDVSGDALPGPGSVVATCHGVTARLGYVLGDIHVGQADEPKFLPQVLIDLPPGAAWAAKLPIIDWERVRRRIVEQGPPSDFRDVFRFSDEILPAPALPALWSLGRDTFSVEMSPSRLDAQMWPKDLVKLGKWSVTWHGGYDAGDVESFLERVCTFAAALMVAGRGP